ncbi:MAG: hypothetical protein K8R60_00400 [Burkholderiales bacterium]|nr:hypothetical protein [Burkholderiales bacterium]
MYDARHPDTAIRTTPAPASTARMVPIKVPAAVLARVGESFAGSLAGLHGSLRALGPLGPDAQPALDAALAEIARLEQLGLQIQELARVLGGDVPLTHEHVDLAAASRNALAEWSRAARAQAIALSGPAAPFELDVNAPALAQLLDLGIEYAMSIGSSIEIATGPHGIPPQPALVLRVVRASPVPKAASEEDFEEIHWLLFVQLARAIGLTPHRLAVADTVTLSLAFPATDATPETAGTSTVDALTRTANAAGRRVLLLEPQDIFRVRAHRLLREAGLWIDAVTNLDAARAAVKDAAPDAVVTGIPAGEPGCEALLAEIRALQPRLRVIELVDDDDAFAFSAPGTDSPARVGRHDMERTLARAMSQELDAAWQAA